MDNTNCHVTINTINPAQFEFIGFPLRYFFTDQQRDLGIIITKDLKWQKQTEKSCRTANRVLGFIARNFRNKNKELILPLYKSLVRPHLEHAVQFWSPHLRRDIDKMEKIQRRATKMIPEIRNHSYTSESRTLISSALYTEGCEDN